MALVDDILKSISEHQGKQVNYDDLDTQEKAQIDIWQSMLLPESPDQKITNLKNKLAEELQKAIDNLGGYDISLEKRLYNTAYYRIIKMLKTYVDGDGESAERAKSEIREIHGNIL